MNRLWTIACIALMSAALSFGVAWPVGRRSRKWGVDRTVTPNAICLFAAASVCATFGTLDGDCNFAVDNALPLVFGSAALAAHTDHSRPVMRGGFAALGDSPVVTYRWSNAACTFNGGAGDKGSQIPPTSGTGCWLLVPFPAAGIDASIFGAVADGTTDNTFAFQACWNYAASIGSDCRVPGTKPGGAYLFKSISSPAGSAPYTGNRAKFVGSGRGQTVLISTVTGATCAITYGETYGYNGSLYGGGGYYLQAQTGFAGQGICLNNVTNGRFGDFAVQGFAAGLSSTNSINITLDRPFFFSNAQGIVTNKGTSSRPNSWLINKPTVVGQIYDSFVFRNSTDIHIVGADMEGNDLANTPGHCTVNMVGAPIDGRKGLSVSGGYYQNNGGTADFCFLQNGSTTDSVHSISGADIGRVGNTTFTSNSIFVENGTGNVKVILSGNSLWSQAPYKQSVSRPYFGVSNPAGKNYVIKGYANNYFTPGADASWMCPAGSANCINEDDGHIRQFGLATLASGAVAVAFPMACPNLVDDVQVTADGPAPFATSAHSYDLAHVSVYGAGNHQVHWQALCH